MIHFGRTSETTSGFRGLPGIISPHWAKRQLAVEETTTRDTALLMGCGGVKVMAPFLGPKTLYHDWTSRKKGEEAEGRGQIENSTPFLTVATLTVVWLKPLSS